MGSECTLSKEWLEQLLHFELDQRLHEHVHLGSVFKDFDSTPELDTLPATPICVLEKALIPSLNLHGRKVKTRGSP